MPSTDELNALLEKFDADQTDLKWSVREEELNRLITLLARQQRERSSQLVKLDPFEDIRMSLSYLSLKGIRDARVMLRQVKQRNQEDRDLLRSYLTRSLVYKGTDESWWTRVKRWWPW